jgi:hypothetical protein
LKLSSEAIFGAFGGGKGEEISRKIDWGIQKKKQMEAICIM